VRRFRGRKNKKNQISRTKEIKKLEIKSNVHGSKSRFRFLSLVVFWSCDLEFELFLWSLYLDLELFLGAVFVFGAFISRVAQ
jgi:hypothetical protein